VSLPLLLYFTASIRALAAFNNKSNVIPSVLCGGWRRRETKKNNGAKWL